MKSCRAGSGRPGDSRCGWSSSSAGIPAIQGASCSASARNVAPSCSGCSTPEADQLGAHHVVAPLRRERLFRRALAEAARAGQHPVRARAGPQRAVRERGAERAHDRARVVLVELLHREPVGGDAAVVQPVMEQLEVLAAVQVDDAGRLGGRRLARDQVEGRGAGLQEEAAVLHVHANPRIGERALPGREHDGRHPEDLGRDVHHVDAGQGARIGQRLGGRAEAVADEQRPPDARVHGQRPVDEQLHVAPVREVRARHGVPVGHQPVRDRLAAPFAAQGGGGLVDALAQGDHPRLFVQEAREAGLQVAGRHRAARKQQQGERDGAQRRPATRGARSGTRPPSATGRTAPPPRRRRRRPRRSIAPCRAPATARTRRRARRPSNRSVFASVRCPAVSPAPDSSWRRAAPASVKRTPESTDVASIRRSDSASVASGCEMKKAAPRYQGEKAA